MGVTAAVTIHARTTIHATVQCLPVVVPARALVDPADCSTTSQLVGVKCRLRCVESATTDDHGVTMTCSDNGRWTVPNALHCLNETILIGLSRFELSNALLYALQ